MSNDLDDLFRLFKSERRRIVLKLLADLQDESANDDVTVRAADLGRQVAAIEANVNSATVGQTVQRSSQVGLHHTHLPMLDEYGIIEFDADANEVTTTNRTRRVAQTMQRIVETVETSEVEITQSTDLDS